MRNGLKYLGSFFIAVCLILIIGYLLEKSKSYEVFFTTLVDLTKNEIIEYDTLQLSGYDS